MQHNHSRSFDNPAAEASQFLIRLGLAVLALGIPLAAVASRRAIFLLFPVGAFVILAGAMLAPRRDALRRMSMPLLSAAGVVALVLIVWAGLSVVWSPFRAEALERMAKGGGTALLAVAAAAVLPQRTRVANLYLAPVGVGLAALATIGVAFIAWASSPHGTTPPADPDGSTLERAVMALSMLVWPAIGALTSRQRFGLATGLVVLVAMAATIVWSPVALLGLAVGVIVFGAGLSDVRRTSKALGTAVAALILLAPLLPFLARILVGSKTSNLQGALAPFAEWIRIIMTDKFRLFTGHGLDSAARSIAAGYLPSNTPRGLLFDLWYELGILGAATMAVLAWRAFNAAGKAHPGAAPSLVGGIAAGVTMSIFANGAAQLAWMTLLATTAVLFTNLFNGQYRTTRPNAPIRTSEPAVPPRR